jgi:hypothetical protein
MPDKVIHRGGCIMSLQHRSLRRGARLSTLLLSILLAAVSGGAARAATTLSIVIAGEPWKDPSTSAVGLKLSVDNRPKEGVLNLGWSTTAPGTMGVSWEVKSTGTTPAVVLSGKAPLPKAAVAGQEYWISIGASFLAPTPPVKPQNYLITVTPFDAQQHANGAASAPVTVTQEADNSPPPSFGRPAVFPGVRWLRYQEYVGSSGLGQLESATGSLKLELTNSGQKPTDPLWLQAKDEHVLMRQPTPLAVPSLAPGHTLVVTLNLTAILPQALSQLPDEQQIREWRKEYQDRGGVDMRVVMDWRGPASSAPMSDHGEVQLYKGSGDSCANGILDGDEVLIPDCGGSCGCCFGRDVAKENWRSVYGYNFPNIPQFQTMAGAYDYGDIQGVFGDCSIYLALCNPIFGLDPFATTYLLNIKGFTGNGRCFGFAYSALNFINGDETLASYPSDGPTCDTWNLKSPLNASNDPNVDLSPDLARMIKRKHLYQFSAEGLNAFLEARWANSSVYWGPRLKNNLPAVLGITACAHAVVVHHVVEKDDGSIDLHLYDPDVPFAAKEDHPAQLALSTLTVRPDGRFDFNDTHVSCSGRASGEFTVFSYADLKNPSMPTADKLTVSFGGVSGEAAITQVADAKGRVLFRPDGTVNDDPQTRIRAFPFHPFDGPRTGPVRLIVADSREAFTHTIIPTGTYEVAFVGPSYAVQINQITGPAGLADQVTIDPKAAAFELATKATQKAVHGQLVTRGADKSTRAAAVWVTLSPNQNVRLEFDAQRDGVVYRHRGAASNVELELWSSLAPRARVRGRPVEVEDGDALSISLNWAQLDQVEGVLRHLKRDGSVRELPLR